MSKFKQDWISYSKSVGGIKSWTASSFDVGIGSRAFTRIHYQVVGGERRGNIILHFIRANGKLALEDYEGNY